MAGKITGRVGLDVVSPGNLIGLLDIKIRQQRHTTQL